MESRAAFWGRVNINAVKAASVVAVEPEAVVAPCDATQARGPDTRAWARLALVPPQAAPAPHASGYHGRNIPAASTAHWRALSLFSGGGGLDLGFLNEGVTADVALDLSKAAVQSYNRNLAPVARVADLTEYTPGDRADVILAGAPCQGFSTVGKRLEHDPRNALLGRIAEVAKQVRPRVVVVENVPAALSGTLRVHWLALERALAGYGYNVRRIELRGEESGLAQRRRRIFMICWKGSDCLRLDLPIWAAPTLRSVLSGVEALADHQPRVLAPGSVDALVARRIAAGQKLCNVRSSLRAIATWDVPEVFGETTQSEKELLRAVSRLRRRNRRRRFGDGDPVARDVLDRELGCPCARDVERLVEVGYLRLVDDFVELRHTYNGKYRRLDWHDLSPTVDTHFGRPALFLHPDEDRGLSPREAARIQGFPDAYVLTGNLSEQFATVGNAVPPPMASRIAAFVREAILKA